mgnify:FL=1
MRMWYPEIFCNSNNTILGVFVDEKAVYMVEVTGGQAKKEISYAGQMLHQSEFTTDEAAGWPERFYSQCQREGLMSRSVALCLRTEDVFTYEKVFPMLRGKELSAAIRWDMEAAVPFEEDSYLYDSYCLDPVANRWLMAAIHRLDVAEQQKAFLDSGLQLAYVTVFVQGLPELQQEGDGSFLLGKREFVVSSSIASIVWSPGLLMALYAAVAAVDPSASLDFLPEEVRPDRWNWPILALTLLLTGALLLGGIYGYEEWQLHLLDRASREQSVELARLSAGAECQRRTQLLESELEQGNTVLHGLSKERFPWYAFLVHFGTQTVEGAWITDLRREKDDCICVQGRAVTYEALSALLARMEGDTDFFRQGAVLKSSQNKGDTGIEFSMQLFF